VSDGGSQTLVLASANAGKVRELRALLADLPLRVRAADEFAGIAFPEEGDDYESNAAAKALAVARATGALAVGDDSGLEVRALGGAPGPHSSRHGGPGLDDAGRCARLLAALDATQSASRDARFVCVIALATQDGVVAIVRGECAGQIANAPRGELGFGYDPIFVPEGGARTMAEIDTDTKNQISHRGRALAALRAQIVERLMSANVRAAAQR
jgi:XTP/dITP diphosphohydrolase